MIVEPASDEAAQLTFDVQWHITDRCNLRCTHCYMEDYQYEPSLEELKDFYGKVKQLPKKNGLKLDISITGGEPLISRNFFPLLNFLAKDPDIAELSVLTNGTLITQQIAQWMKANRVNLVQVSVDGGNPAIHDEIRGKGSFTRTMKGISLLLEAGLTVQVQMVVHRKNVASLPELVDRLDAMGPIRLLITRLVPQGEARKLHNLLLSPEEYRETLLYLQSEAEAGRDNLQILKHRQLWRLIDPKLGSTCPIGLSGLTLLPEGTILPCRRLPLSIGNLRTQSIFQIWYTSELLWALRDRNNLKGKCGYCQFRDICGGCRAVAYGYYGDYLAEDPTCWIDEINEPGGSE